MSNQGTAYQTSTKVGADRHPDWLLKDAARINSPIVIETEPLLCVLFDTSLITNLVVVYPELDYFTNIQRLLAEARIRFPRYLLDYADHQKGEG